MKLLFNILFGLFLFISTAFAGQAQTTSTPIQIIPVSLGAEWNNTNGFLFATTCFSPKFGGLSCVYFPNGGKLHGFSFLSSSKKGAELLWDLTWSPRGLGQYGSEPEQVLQLNHHAPNVFTVYRDVTFAQGYYFNIPAGSYIYIRGQGPLTSTPDGEAQVTLWIESVPVNRQ